MASYEVQSAVIILSGIRHSEAFGASCEEMNKGGDEMKKKNKVMKLDEGLRQRPYRGTHNGVL